MNRKNLLWAGLGLLALFAPGSSPSSAGIPSPLPPLPEGLKKYHLDIRARQLKFYDLFQRAAKLYKLPLQMVLAIGHGEGSGNPSAKSSAGALGLMQLMPNTARGLGLCVPLQPGEDPKKVRKSAKRCAGAAYDERLDPALNIFAGCKLLRELLSAHKSWDRVLAAYNSGNADPELRQGYIKYIRRFLPLYQGF